MTAVRHGLTLFVLGCFVTVIICIYNLGLSDILWEIIYSDAWWIVCCDVMYRGLGAALRGCSPGPVNK